MPQISQRGFDMPASPIRKLVPFANKARQEGKKVYPLNIGQPDIHTPEEAFTALKNIDRKILEYSPSEGILSLREKLTGYYKRFNINVSAEDIIVTTGGSEALFATFLACLDPGDEILLPEPSYANYLTFAMACGVKTIPIPASIETGFALPPVEELEKMITPRTKALLICNPNNPTGYLYTAEEMHKIEALVKKHNLFLVSDEVYREFRYTDEPYVSALHLKEVEQNVIMIDSVSKRYSECGIRIGMIVTKNAKVREGVMKWCQARLSPPLLGQIAAEASLDVADSYLKDVYDEYIERRNVLVEGLNRIPGCFCTLPRGAFYTVVKLPIDNSDKFCQWCLEEFAYNNETIFMAPATGFYTTPGKGTNEVRIAYVLNTTELKGALVVLEKALEAYPGRVD
ncbi:MAG: pyridoxal phosphate-dependent aminotransferase [Marinifilaceae bacterium]